MEKELMNDMCLVIEQLGEDIRSLAYALDSINTLSSEVKELQMEIYKTRNKIYDV